MDYKKTQILSYLESHNQASAGELAAIVGLTVQSIRYRLYQLMANGIVGQEKTRNHRVWFFLLAKKEKDTRKAKSEKVSLRTYDTPRRPT